MMGRILNCCFHHRNIGPLDNSSYQKFVEEIRATLGGELEDKSPGWQQMPLIKLGAKLNRYLTTSGA